MKRREKAALPRRGVPSTPVLRARLFLRSQNRKLGGIPASITSRGTCPPSCGFYGAGCYAEFHLLAAHWRRVGDEGETWSAFCADVEALPEGQLWRHNTAGDLPGQGDGIAWPALRSLILANVGRRGFTFTHKHRSSANLRAIRESNDCGLTVNLSADSLADADRLAELGCGPVAVVLASDTPDKGTSTPAGRKVVVCPAQTDSGLTCATCRLCAIPWRRAIVGFRAHGQASVMVDEKLVQLRRSA